MRTAHQSHFYHGFYDQLSRLIEADYNNGANVYNYGYDVAGNLVDYDGVTRTYNAANQMIHDGTNTLTYDNNGNLRTVGSDTYTWDRANRLLSVGNHSYAYDGLGNRVQQTVSSVVTDYLNDLQPGLTKLLKQDDGTNTEHFVHAPRGIHAVDNGTGWNFYAHDGLGSVRAVLDDSAGVQSSMSFDPYGNPMATYGTGFGFTGEQTDANEAIFLRARYYEPDLGVFSALDPFEGVYGRPMSLNGYSWVEGNVPNAVDPSGMCCECERLNQPNTQQSYVNCLRTCLAPYQLPDYSPVDSAVVIYTFRDGSPNSSATACEFGGYPASLSLGTITTDGIYTHDHFGLPVIEDLDATELVVDSNFAENPQQAQTYLQQHGCIEIRGKNGSIAISGNSIQFGSSQDGIVLMQGDFSRVGCPTIKSHRFVEVGDGVQYVKMGVSAQPLTARTFIASSLKDRAEQNPNMDIQFRFEQNLTGIRHQDLIIGNATVANYGMETIGVYGTKPAIAIGEEPYQFFQQIFQAGDSGGGLFNSNGELVGALWGAAQRTYGFRGELIEFFHPILPLPQ